MKSKLSILIIGDDPPLQQTLALMFRQRGYLAISTAPSLQTLEILDGYPFDLVVMDLNQITDICLSLFFKIKKNNLHLPVILLSANSESDFIPGFEEEEGWMIIRKPFEPGFLLKSIHAITSATVVRSSLPFEVGN